MCFLFAVFQLSKFLLELFHLFKEVGQLAVIDHFSPFLVGFDGWHAKERLSFLGHAFINGGQGIDNGSVCNVQILVDDGLGPDDTFVA